MLRAYGNAEELRKSPCLPPLSQPIHHPQSELGRYISLIGDWNEGSRLHRRWGVWGMQDMRLQFESYYRVCPSLSQSRLRTSHACDIRMGGRKTREQVLKESWMRKCLLSFLSVSFRHIKNKWLWTGTDGQCSFFYYNVIKHKYKELSTMTQPLWPGLI